MVKDTVTETEAARLAAAASPLPTAEEIALVVPTDMKTIIVLMASQMAHAGPSAASCSEETCPTAAVSMRLRRVGAT